MGSEDIRQVAQQFREHLGDAVGEEYQHGALRWQTFELGSVVASGRGVCVVYGEIARLYSTIGGPAGGLGAPVTHELDAGDGTGRYNDFERGSIYWSPTTGAHEVHGNIGMRWVADGRTKGRLGYPVTDELSHPPYAYQYFQYGALRWSPQNGVQVGPPPDRLYGLADTHAHPAAHLGFGGGLVSGLVEGPPEEALADCHRDHGVAGTGLFHIGVRDLPGSVAAAFVHPLAGLAIRAADDVVHGITLGGLEGSAGHWTEGYPKFDGWPRYNSRVHQQMYLEWVERSYRYGQRLMVALANHSNVLAATGGADPGQRDMDAAVAELTYMRDLVDRTDWMELARDPAEAREIIARDHMAVILGVELDTMGGLEQRARDWDDRSGHERAAAVTDAELDALVQVLHDLDVRYVFPVHLTDNVFGGAALYRSEFMEASAIEGRPVTTEDRPDLAFGKVNRNGLSDAGRRLLTRLMARGMLIDIDHMSWRTTGQVLAFTVNYPLVSGHATFHELAVPDAHADAGGSDESRKEPATLAELARRGSYVGVQPVAQPLAPHPDADSGLSADCPGSSTQFARAYQYAVARTGGRVTIGSDLNGFASTCGPRFGPGAAPGLADTDSRRMVEGVQRGGVRYTAPLHHPVVRRLEHPGHMWTERRRELLYAIQVAEAGQTVPADIFKPHIAATVEGFRSAREPGPGPARVAYRARRGLGRDELGGGADRELYDDIAWVLERHRSMENGPNPPLERCVTGGHDWDYNLEGLAHYGLIPDMIHDLGNLGLSWDRQLMPLLTSAETVVSTWERCHDQGGQTQDFVARKPDPRTLGPSLQWIKPPVGVRLPPIDRSLPR